MKTPFPTHSEHFAAVDGMHQGSVYVDNAIVPIVCYVIRVVSLFESCGGRHTPDICKYLFLFLDNISFLSTELHRDRITQTKVHHGHTS